MPPSLFFWRQTLLDAVVVRVKITNLRHGPVELKVKGGGGDKIQ